MPRYGFATLLEEHPVGYTFTVANTPLHLTHVDSFAVDLDIAELAATLQQTLTSQKPFSIQALADVRLGPSKDIPVTRLERTPELMALHTVIMDMLEAAGAVLKNPQFHRDLYDPHVSIYGARRVAVGDIVCIKDVSIGVKTGDGADALYRIVATATLNG